MIGTFAAVLMLALAPGDAAAKPAAGGEPIYQIEAADAAMNAAIAEGRRTLPAFYRRLAAPQPGDGEFMVKFDIDPSDEAEFVWAADLDRSTSPMTGRLINQPVNTSDRLGDRVAIAEASIIDWGYRTGGVVQGNFTNRVLLEHMPPEEAASYRRFLGW
jgi:uncharacterized protein YegJ (DUF2314 family)